RALISSTSCWIWRSPIWPCSANGPLCGSMCAILMVSAAKLFAANRQKAAASSLKMDLPCMVLLRYESNKTGLCRCVLQCRICQAEKFTIHPCAEHTPGAGSFAPGGATSPTKEKGRQHRPSMGTAQRKFFVQSVAHGSCQAQFI